MAGRANQRALWHELPGKALNAIPVSSFHLISLSPYESVVFLNYSKGPARHRHDRRREHSPFLAWAQFVFLHLGKPVL